MTSTGQSPKVITTILFFLFSVRHQAGVKAARSSKSTTRLSTPQSLQSEEVTISLRSVFPSLVLIVLNVLSSLKAPISYGAAAQLFSRVLQGASGLGLLRHPLLGMGALWNGHNRNEVFF